MSETRPNIFLSYAWDDDQEFVRKLREDLEAAGFTVWQDERDLPSRGPDLPAELRAAIDRADRFVPVIGPTATNTGNTPGTNLNVEWNYARSTCRAVTPILRKGEPSLIPADFGRESLRFDFREDVDYNSKLADLIDRLKAPAQVATLYHVPELPRGFLPREKYLAELRERVLGQTPQAVITSQQQTSALQGMGGVGKSVLAAAFARDCSVRRRFYDGVFWLTIGIEPSESRLVDQMKGMGAALGDDVGQYHSLSSAGSRLAEILKERACLLILDDVWDIRHAEPFRNVVGNRCGLLATTRDGRIATDLSGKGGESVCIDILSEEDALILLARTAKLSAPEQLPEEALEIADQCGYLAFALALCGSSAGEGTLWADILDALKDQDLTYLQRQLPDYPYPDMLKALKVSIDLLEKHSPVTANHYRELAVFPSDTAIPEEAIVTFWTNSNGLKPREARQIIADLGNLSLIKAEGDAPARLITLHDLQYAYLIAEVRDQLAKLHGMLLAAYLKHYGITEWAQMPAEELYLWWALATHLKGAGRIDELNDLLLDAAYLQAKCAATGIGSLLDDCKAALPDEDVHLVSSALTLSAHVLAAHPNELCAQMRGRLWVHRERSAIKSLLKTLSTPLLSMNVVLAQADGALVRTLKWHTDEVNGALELADGRLLSWSEDGTLRLWSTKGEPLHTLQGHMDTVLGALELADGRLLSWSRDSTLRLWSAEGEALHVVEGHTGWIIGALELVDGRLLSWSEDGTLRLWNTKGDPLRTLQGQMGTVLGALELADGRLLSWSQENVLRLWSANGEPLLTLEGHTGWATGALELTGGRLLSWSEDNTLQLWSAKGGPLRTLEGHSDMVTSVLELANGRLLSWSWDGTLRIWGAEGEPLHVLEGHSRWVMRVLELVDGRLLSCSEDHTLRLWSAEGRRLSILEGHALEVTGALELADGRLLSWSGDDTLRLWSPEGEPLHTLEGHTGRVTGALELADGRLLSWSEDGTLRLWSIEDKRLRTAEEHTRWVIGVLELADGRLLSWSEDNTLRLWSAKGEPLQMLEGHTGTVMGALELADGRLLSWSWDDTLRLWSAEGKRLLTLKWHTDAVSGVLALADGRLLSWSKDGTLRLWSSEGKRLSILNGHAEDVNGALELADGRLLSWSEDGTLRLWSHEGRQLSIFGDLDSMVTGALDLVDGRLLSWSRHTLTRNYTLCLWSTEGAPLHVLEGHNNTVIGALELVDGRLLSWSEDGLLRLWSPKGEPLRVLEGHTRRVIDALELPDGRLLSWSEDSTLRLWSPDGEALHALEGHTDWVTSALELPDGRLLSWSEDGTLRMWDAEGKLTFVFYCDAPVTCCMAYEAGHRIAAGDAQGRLMVFEVGE